MRAIGTRGRVGGMRMTEQEWLDATPSEAVAMINWVSGAGFTPPPQSWKRASLRKLLLLAHACYSRGGHLMPDPRTVRAVEALEAYAQGRLDPAGFSAAAAGASEANAQLASQGNSPMSYAERQALTAYQTVAFAVMTMSWSAASAAAVALHHTPSAMKFWAK